jgi:toxin ParE1/3/4
MKYKLIFRPEVEEDAIEGYVWYEKKAVGLGEEFLTQFYKYTSDITQRPLVYRKTYEKFRRCLLKKFPYAIYFQIEGDKVVVFGLFHCAREPKTIGMALSDRNKKHL